MGRVLKKRTNLAAKHKHWNDDGESPCHFHRVNVQRNGRVYSGDPVQDFGSKQQCAK